jgi:hypothetical protein
MLRWGGLAQAVMKDPSSLLVVGGVALAFVVSSLPPQLSRLQLANHRLMDGRRVGVNRLERSPRAAWKLASKGVWTGWRRVWDLSLMRR